MVAAVAAFAEGRCALVPTRRTGAALATRLGGLAVLVAIPSEDCSIRSLAGSNPGLAPSTEEEDVVSTSGVIESDGALEPLGRALELLSEA